MTHDRTDLLEPSPHDADGGEFVGKRPTRQLVAAYRDCWPAKPMKAIRAKCLDCAGGNTAEVRKCTATDCPLWPHRMGRNPFYGATTPE